MGFSLKAALAGAIAGGARAVGQIADLRIKEESDQRARDEAFQKQKELELMRDELAFERAKRVDELKTAREDNLRTKKADALKEGLASLREQKIDPGSIKGQQALATQLANAGFSELADKYYDNSIKLSQIESAAETKKMEAQFRHDAVREAREARAERTSAADYDRKMTTAIGYGNKLRIASDVDPSKKEQFSEAGSAFGFLFQRLTNEAGLKPTEALSDVGEASTALGVALRSGKDPSAALNGTIDYVLKKRGLLAGEDKASPPETQAAPAPAPAKPTRPRIPSVFESRATGILERDYRQGSLMD